MSFAGAPQSPNYTGPVTIAPKRSIGPIKADATVTESHSDELAITDHPVQQGAAITDHAFKIPASLVIRAGFSNSSEQANGNEDYINKIYSQFLQLQSDRTLIDVFTGRRTYKNMLVKSLAQETSEEFENAMILVIGLRQLVLVTTQTVTLPAEVQKSPEKTGSVINTGTKQAAPVKNPPPAASPSPQQSTGAFLKVPVL